MAELHRQRRQGKFVQICNSGRERKDQKRQSEREGTESNTPKDRALHEEKKKKNRKGWDTNEIKSGCCQTSEGPAIR